MTEQSVGQQAAALRTRIGYSVRKMAEETGVHRDSITRIEKDDDTLGSFTRDRYLSALERMEKRLGIDHPERVVNVTTLPDGTKVSFTGSPLGVAEAATAFLARREQK